MSWDNDAISVLPEGWQDDVRDNFSPEYLAEKLSEYVVQLQERVEVLEAVNCKADEHFSEIKSADQG